MQSLDKILSSVKMDARLQSLIDYYLGKDSVSSLLVVGLTFEGQGNDCPAFSLGGQITFMGKIPLPIGIICVSDDFCRTLTDGQLEFVVLHELGHIVMNHWATNLIILLSKDFIVEQLAKFLEISIENAKAVLGLIKAFVVLANRETGTIEEKLRARTELEADRYAVLHQGVKEPAISILSQLGNGNMNTPTHVTVDGSFAFQVITAGERIAAIREEPIKLGQYLREEKEGYEPFEVVRMVT